MKAQLIDNQKAFKLENEVSEAAKRVIESKENINLLTKAIDKLHKFFGQYKD